MFVITHGQSEVDAVENSELFERLESKLVELVSFGIQGLLYLQRSKAERAVLFHLQSGGKRTRGRLALQPGISLGWLAHDAICLAAATELLHNASLVHDDVQDGDRSRHGQPSVWVKLDAPPAICAGDLLQLFHTLRVFFVTRSGI